MAVTCITLCYKLRYSSSCISTIIVRLSSPVLSSWILPFRLGKDQTPAPAQSPLSLKYKIMLEFRHS